jgi:hypothetical protein
VTSTTSGFVQSVMCSARLSTSLIDAGTRLPHLPTRTRPPSSARRRVCSTRPRQSGRGDSAGFGPRPSWPIILARMGTPAIRESTRHDPRVHPPLLGFSSARYLERRALRRLRALHQADRQDHGRDCARLPGWNRDYLRRSCSIARLIKSPGLSRAPEWAAG